MTESESSQEILKLLHELNSTIKSIDSKLDNKANEVNEVNIDESSGDVHITRKLLQPPLIAAKIFKSESESESELKSKSESINRHTATKILKPLRIEPSVKSESINRHSNKKRI